MSPTEVAWLAGIIEGEGSFVAGAKTACRIQVVMTDIDIIDRIAALTGVGFTYLTKPNRTHYKVAKGWAVRRAEHVQHIISLVRPWLGARRREAADKLVTRMAGNQHLDG